MTFDRAKGADLAWASPLIAWYGWTLWSYTPDLMRTAGDLGRGAGQDAPILAARLLAQLSSLSFAALLVVLLIVRMPPVSASAGIAPRLTAIAGTFAALLFQRLPLAPLSVAWSIAAALLVTVGFGLSFYVLAWLGRSFSIVPEARRLVTHGPYAIVRHPLYAVEEIAILGIAMQYAMPLSAILFAAHLALQIARMGYEERVLAAAFPDYAAYAARKKRLIPGVY